MWPGALADAAGGKGLSPEPPAPGPERAGTPEVCDVGGRVWGICGEPRRKVEMWVHDFYEGSSVCRPMHDQDMDRNQWEEMLGGGGGTGGVRGGRGR